MSNFMIACVLLNISKNNSGLKGLLNFNSIMQQAGMPQNCTGEYRFLVTTFKVCIDKSSDMPTKNI